MEHVHGAHDSSHLAPEEDDVISDMPDNVITNIMDRLPIQDAVSTGILSRNWRFKWNMVTQLIFDDKFFEYLQGIGTKGENWYSERNISSLFLHLKGPITKFDLYLPHYMVFHAKDINHWILFLSRKGIQEFTLLNMHETPLTLPSHLFSCPQLKHLKLDNCAFRVSSNFRGFPNLLSLDLSRVTFESGGCVDLITQCLLLETLKITYHDPIEKIKLVEIAKLENLKILSFPLRMLDNIVITSASIFQLGVYLPKLEELNLDFQGYEFVGETGAREWVCNTFPSLKTLGLYPINFSCGRMVSWAFEMIWGAPNLETLTITDAYTNGISPPVISSSEVDYKTLGQLQLRCIVFVQFRGSENEVYLVKCLLACSPLLKNIIIFAKSSVVFGGDNGKLILATKLLKLHRVSPFAEVDLYWI